jgi:hypothetical protein
MGEHFYTRLLIFLSFFSVSLLYAPGQIDSQTVIDLKFERFFPETAYSRVHDLCLEIWYSLRNEAQKNDLSLGDWTLLDDQFINKLITLHNQVELMLQKPANCSPDDIEYLAWVLQRIYVEYRQGTYTRKIDEKTVCNSVLFGRIKESLEKILN